MTQSRSLIVAWGLVLAAVLVALWAYAVLPADAGLAYHRGFGGPTDGHLPKTYALALLPAIMTLVVGALSLAPHLNRRNDGLERSARPYSLFVTALAGVLFVTHAGLAWRMMNGASDADVIRVVFLAVAVLLMITGNYLGKVRHNFVFGVRTRWTLEDPRVWDKTHRVAGRLMVAGGFGLAAACLLVRDLPVLVATMILLTAAPPLYAAIYSRQVWRREHQA